MKGFTLIELLVTITIVAILAALSIPSYQAFIERSKLISGTEELSSLRGLMEQVYQANRTYLTGTACTIGNFSGEYFAQTCSGTATTFTWTATSAGGVGLGAAGDYVYTIDEDGVRATTKYAGATPSVTTGWKIRP